jgi:hypothetical protein
MKNDKTITISVEKLKMIGLFFVIMAILGFSFYIAQNYIPAQREISKQAGYLNGTQLGYQRALYDVAYTVATEGEVSYVIPTTNITLILVEKK